MFIPSILFLFFFNAVQNEEFFIPHKFQTSDWIVLKFAPLPPIKSSETQSSFLVRSLNNFFVFHRSLEDGDYIPFMFAKSFSSVMCWIVCSHLTAGISQKDMEVICLLCSKVFRRHFLKCFLIKFQYNIEFESLKKCYVFVKPVQYLIQLIWMMYQKYFSLLFIQKYTEVICLTCSKVFKRNILKYSLYKVHFQETKRNANLYQILFYVAVAV